LEVLFILKFDIFIIVKRYLDRLRKYIAYKLFLVLTRN